MGNVQQDHGHQQDQLGQQDQRYPIKTIFYNQRFSAVSQEFVLIQEGGLRPLHGHQSFQRGRQLQGHQEHQGVQEVQQHHSHHGLPIGENRTEVSLGSFNARSASSSGP